ncbi:YfmQ family protein [Metabacillus sp. FJAT-53654]|uniref:YfmQ family protein n=1 Tax=Metabacillus rhizosphaerae TaxID=3117747 RepID=A0ABZ2MPI3_9BACI
MTWPFVILLILAGLLKIVVTCLPTGVVEWLISKYELHQKLSNETVTVTIDGKHLVGADKIQVINYFNEALYLERYYTSLENSVTPLIIDTTRGKNNVRLFVYIYNDRVDVVKTYKKKVVAYRLRSDNLQKRSFVVTEDLA